MQNDSETNGTDEDTIRLLSRQKLLGVQGWSENVMLKKMQKKHIQHDAHIKDLNTIIPSCHIQAKLGFQMKIYRYCHILHSKI